MSPDASSATTPVQVRQITHASTFISNIYCERPYCAADSSRFLYARRIGETSPDILRTQRSDKWGEWEYVLCEFGTWKERVVSRGQFGVSTSYDNDFYHQRINADGRRELVRVDLNNGNSETVWTAPPDTPYLGHPTVSSGGQYLAYRRCLSYDPQRFGVAVVDLKTGEEWLAMEHSDAWNTHLQFDPADPHTLLVQVNRGARFDTDGKCLQRADERGATLWLLNTMSGQVDELQIGKPHTSRCTGHQAWIGNTSTVVVTVAPEGEYAAEPGGGSIVTIRKGEPPRQLETGLYLNHIGSTPCGRYIYGDTVEHDKIAIINPDTGASRIVHEDESQPYEKTYDQLGHPHAYLSPDFRWMVFNSDRTGQPQLYCASIPPSCLP